MQAEPYSVPEDCEAAERLARGWVVAEQIAMVNAVLNAALRSMLRGESEEAR